MKRFTTLLYFLGATGLFLVEAPKAHAQTGIGTLSPDASSMLDITSANRGLLIPRVALTGVSDKVTVTSPANSLLVYNTSASIAGPGIYFNSGDRINPNWERFVSSSAPVAVGLDFWRTTGNAATNAANFLGTTDAQDLVFKVNSRERFRIRPGGSSNGTSLLTSDFEVSGGTTLSGDVKVVGNNSITTLRETNIGLPSDKGLLSVYGEVTINGATAKGSGTAGTGSLSVFGPTNLNSTLTVAGVPRFTTLGGTGTRLVVADNLGNLSTQTVAASDYGILNQSASPQAASFNISGTGRIGGALNVGSTATLNSAIVTTTLSAGATTLSSLGVAGNSSLGGALGVTGATTLATLTAGPATLTGVTTLSGLTGTGTRYVTVNSANQLVAVAPPAIPSTTDYISNTTALQTGANFNIGGSGKVGGTFGVTGLTTLSGLTAGSTSTSDLTATAATVNGTLRVSGTSTLDVLNAGATSVTNLNTSGLATLSSASVTNGITAGAATLGSARVTGLAASGAASNRLVVTNANGDLIAGSTVPGSNGEFISNVGTPASPAFNIAGAGQIGGTLTVTGTSNLGALNAGATTLGSTSITNGLGVSGTTNLAGLSAGATSLSSLSTGATTVTDLSAGAATLGSARVTGLAASGAASNRLVVTNANGDLIAGSTVPGSNGEFIVNNGGATPSFNISGAGQIGGTLTVTGTSNLGTLNAGASTLNSANVSTTLVVNGATNLATLNAGTTNLASTLTVAGNVVPSANTTYSLGTPTLTWAAVYANNGVVQTSDARLKTNVTGLGYGMSTVMAMRPVRYAWKKTPNQNNKIGFIAQELQKVVPEVVSVGNDANQTLGVNYAELVPVLVKALQEQQAQLDAMRGRAEKAEAAVQSFESRLRALEAGSPVNATAQGQR